MAQAVEALLGLLERLRRDVDQVHVRRQPSRLQRLGQQQQLLAAPAPQFDDGGPLVFTERGNNRGTVLREQPRLRPRDAIPRQPADRLEEARAERVVEIFRLKLLRGEPQIPTDVGGEFCDE